MSTLAARAVSIRDVAALAGVSVGSASRVINHASNVTPSTRERVALAIAQLGYQPNHAAQSLRLRASRTIGVMLTDVSNPLYAQLFRAVEDRFREAGYMLLLANGMNDVERELSILATFKSRGMDGVLLAPGHEHHPPLLAALRTLGMPAVILDRDIDAPPEGSPDSVQFDHASGMHAVVSHLIEQGHRDIALVLAQTTIRPMRRRLEGFRAAFDARGLPVPEASIVHLPRSSSPAFDAVTQMLTRPRRPSAVVSLGSGALHETLHAIHAQRLAIPTDISLVALGDPDFARHHVPPLSVLRVDVNAVAAQCATWLLDGIQQARAPHARRVTIAPELVIRHSCGPCPAALRER